LERHVSAESTLFSFFDSNISAHILRSRLESRERATGLNAIDLQYANRHLFPQKDAEHTIVMTTAIPGMTKALVSTVMTLTMAILQRQMPPGI
jgi:ABC-type lipoprotein release transport system permease subunit